MEKSPYPQIEAAPVIPTCDLIYRLAYLSGKGDSATSSEKQEITLLRNLSDSLTCAPGWGKWMRLVREDSLDSLTKQDFLTSLEVQETEWPYCHIDWKAAMVDLRKDYNEVEYMGVKYLYKARGLS